MSSSYAQCPVGPAVQERRTTTRLAYCVDPLHDSRWDCFLRRHPRASLFHSSPWLKALRKTYGYEAIAYTTSPPENDLDNAIVLCKIKSWLTGRRLVSLPFSDHCEPLVDSVADMDVLAAALKDDFEKEQWGYVETRPLQSCDFGMPLGRTTATYAFHKLDLRPSLDTLFENLHKSSIQRKIRRAEREGLIYREGSTNEFLSHFCRLFTLTRKRHGLPPQPRAWFTNLIDYFGDGLKIRLTFNGNRPIAAIITIAYKDTLTYKYGCCEAQFNNLGPMHLLFWNAIREAKLNGLRFLDFGRTDADQQGLITFKNRWGASQSILTYSRYGVPKRSSHLCDLYSSKRKSKAVKSMLKLVPPKVLSVIGQFLYRHIG